MGFMSEGFEYTASVFKKKKNVLISTGNKIIFILK